MIFASAEEATVNPDGSTTFENNAGDSAGDAGADAGADGAETMEEIVKAMDPAWYLAFVVFLMVTLYMLVHWRNKRASSDMDDFFSNLDGDKFNLKLPAAVDEYYVVKAKCEEDGWVPGEPPSHPPGQQPPANSPHRLLAQALMKRCIADIPIVQHIQRESPGMNKLYSQSMCSVRQWKSYQAAEAMVSAEVEEVRAEADEVEPGWSQVIWRQAMQYHNMLKQKQEQEEQHRQFKAQKALELQKKHDEAEAAEKAKYEEVKAKVDAEKARIARGERIAEELIKQEEREKESKKAFKEGSGMKKGFLDTKKK